MTAKSISEETRCLLREQTDKLLEAFYGVFEASYRHGNKSALLTTMYAHLHHGRPIPKWAQAAFIKAYLSYPASWDDVFGRPVEKGKVLPRNGGSKKTRYGSSLQYVPVARRAKN